MIILVISFLHWTLILYNYHRLYQKHFRQLSFTALENICQLSCQWLSNLLQINPNPCTDRIDHLDRKGWGICQNNIWPAVYTGVLSIISSSASLTISKTSASQKSHRYIDLLSIFQNCQRKVCDHYTMKIARHTIVAKGYYLLTRICWSSLC